MVALETVQGERLLAQILFAFDEGETPDLFYLEVVPGAGDTWVQKRTAGHSVLLSEIARVEFPPTQISEPNQ